MSDDAPDPQHLRIAEAVLFAASEPVHERAVAAHLPDGVNAVPVLEALKEHYQGRGVTLNRAGRSWAFRTAADLAPVLGQETSVTRKLGRATIEVLAVIAYHQPVTRGEIEEIRGVGLSKGTLDILFETGWIRPKGRRRTPGRPVTWGTTDAFLDHFGLETIRDLPGVAELRAAGLLDARPAIQTYTSQAEGDAPELPLEEGAVEMPEPLDPDDGVVGEEG